MNNTNSIEERLEKIEKLLIAQKEALTFEEACQYTGISKSYMYKLTCTNKIPHFKPHGKHIYFKKEELDNWLLKNPIKTTEQLQQEAATYVIAPTRKEEFAGERKKAVRVIQKPTSKGIRR